jgi:hypothetical protein
MHSDCIPYLVPPRRLDDILRCGFYGIFAMAYHDMFFIGLLCCYILFQTPQSRTSEPPATTAAAAAAAADNQALQKQLIDALQRAQAASDHQQHLQQQLTVALSEAQEAKAQQEALQQQLDYEVAERQQLVQEQEQLQQQLQQLEEEHQGLQQQVGDLQEQRELLRVAQEQQQQLEGQLRELEQQLEAAKQDREELQLQIDEAAAVAASSVAAAAGGGGGGSSDGGTAATAGLERESMREQQAAGGKLLAMSDLVLAEGMGLGDSGVDLTNTVAAAVTPERGLAAVAAGDERGAMAADGSPAEHAVRAELRVSQAEVARLRHELDVKRSSADQQLHLAQKEILRLQGILPSEESAGAASRGAELGDGGMDEMREGGGDLGNGLDQGGGLKRDEVHGWALVVENPAYMAEHQFLHGQQVQVGHKQQQQGEDVAVSWYEQRLADMEDTIGSLRQQLKLQEQTVVALQRRTGHRVRGGGGGGGEGTRGARRGTREGKGGARMVAGLTGGKEGKVSGTRRGQRINFMFSQLRHFSVACFIVLLLLLPPLEVHDQLLPHNPMNGT